MLALIALSFSLPLCAVFPSTQETKVAPPAGSVASGAHFRLTAHFDDAKLAAEALACAEAVWPWTIALFGEPPVDPMKPLEVHLYRTIADYEAAEAEITQGKFKRNLAFTSDETGAAYVALQPDVADTVLSRMGMPLQTRQLLAHEASHVIAGRVIRNYSTWPSWLSEGAATWISEQAMKKEGWIDGSMEDPMLSTSAVRVKALLAAKTLPSLAQVFDDEIGELDFSERYGLWLHTFRFLHEGKHAAALGRIMAAARRTGGGSGHLAAVAKSAREELSKNGDLSAIDREFAVYVRDLAPRWDEVRRSLSTTGDAWVQAAFASSNAICWRTEDVRSERYEVSGEVEIFAGPPQQMNLLLARTPNGFVQVAFTAGYGVDVFEYDNRRLEDAQWKRLGTAKVEALVAGKPVPFKVKVAKSKLMVEIAGKRACEADTGDHPMSGAFGLGALARSAGNWRKVTVKKG